LWIVRKMTRQDSESEGKAEEEIKQEFFSSMSNGTSLSPQSLIDTDHRREELNRDQLKNEIALRLQQGQRPNRGEYLLRFPAYQQLIVEVFDELERILFGSDGQFSFATVPNQTGVGNDDRETSKTPPGSSSAAARLPLIGNYCVIREIAKGGMGVVYQATHVQLGRLVALKMIRTDYLVDRSIVERFTTEAKAVARLDHPNIVPVYDFGEFEGQPYYAMAFVDGESLAERVSRDGPISPATAGKMMIEIVAAVQHAHERGIIHRDIKPQNILVQEVDKVQVTDFGLAKLQDTNSTLTREGQVLGTPAYMSPEQAAGDSTSNGERSDIYSLGATLYYLLTARPPFQAAGLNEILRQVMDVEPIRLRQLDPSLPRDLETICLKCLAKAPELRYSTAAAMGDDIKRWLNGEPIHARRSGIVRNLWLWCRRKPVVAALAATAALAAVLGIMTMLERQRRFLIESEVAARKDVVVAEAGAILENGRKFLAAEDYENARAERQKLVGMEPELQGQVASVELIHAFTNQLDAIRDFEIARVQRCGMPSCKFDYVNFSPVDILRRLGLDFSSQSVSELSERIAQTDIDEEIVAALDDWALVLSETVNDPYREYLPKLIEVCNSIDKDEKRKGIRATLLGDYKAKPQDIPKLSSDELRKLKPTSIVFLASVLAKAGQKEQAIELLSEGFLAYPDNFWLNLRLAEIAREFSGSMADVRLKHLEIARVLRPYNTVLIHNLVSEYARQNRIQNSKQLLTAAIENSPDDPFLHHAFALLYHTHINDLEEAQKIYDRNIELFPNFVQSYLNLAGIVANKGDLKRARVLLDTALPIQLKKCEGANVDSAEIYNLAFVYYRMWELHDGKVGSEGHLRLRELTLGKLREVLPFDRDGLYSSLLMAGLLKAAAECESLNLVDEQLAYLKEALPLVSGDEHWNVLNQLAAFYFSKGDLEASRKFIGQAAEKLPKKNDMAAANILVLGAIVHAAISDRLQTENPIQNLLLRQSTENKAVRYLRQAMDIKYFEPLPFGLMLSTREDFRPLDESPLFWEVVLDSFRLGFVEDIESAEEPSSPAYYLAARASIKLASMMDEEAGSLGGSSAFELRLQAYRWITKKITVLREAVNTQKIDPKFVKNALNLWKRDPGWEPVRKVNRLETLPPAERDMWAKFWKEVDDVAELSTKR
jgi:tetratricopeptide (TPR) repeat protein/tRNA A-37 threonylcarbamoyl transferase component Bud32